MEIKSRVMAYFILGFSAPAFFWFLPAAQAGKIAGVLFIAAAVLAMRVSYQTTGRSWMTALSLLSLVSDLIFYSWRWTLSAPLAESILWGLTGTQWHNFLTILYLFVGVSLLVRMTK
ncbi:MAG: hypothetical protein IT289_02575 [Oligoflexia bacterium]|nr:hypothetical protein [Oligoflexia bacterium]